MARTALLGHPRGLRSHALLVQQGVAKHPDRSAEAAEFVAAFRAPDLGGEIPAAQPCHIGLGPAQRRHHTADEHPIGKRRANEGAGDAEEKLMRRRAGGRISLVALLQTVVGQAMRGTREAFADM